MKRITVALLGLAAAGLAQAGEMKPGKWDYVTKIEMPGLPFPMPPVKFQHCLTQQDLDERKQYQGSDQKDCAQKNFKQTGSSVSFDFECKGSRPATGHYDFTFTETSLKGKGTVVSEGQTMNYAMDATRSGDCAK